MLNIFKHQQADAEPAVNIRDLIHDDSNYFSDELIVLDEPLTGNLFCAEKVFIKKHGILNGNVVSKNCMVTGVVNGNITSLDLLDIKASAVVRGNIQSATIHIEPGAIVNGYIIVGEEIEALTAQWNKTKFSTDDYLTANLKRDLAEVNKLNTMADIVVQQKIEPGLVAAVKRAGPLKAALANPQQEQPERGIATAERAVKPSLTAAAPPVQPESNRNDQKIERWW